VGKNSPIQFLATPGDIRIQAKQTKDGGMLTRVITVPLQIADPDKTLAVKLQELQTHRCLVTLAIHQLVAGEGEGEKE